MGVRIISAAVGTLIAVIVFFLHDTPVLPVAVALLCAIMLFELFRAAGFEKKYTLLSLSVVYSTLKVMTFATAFAKYSPLVEILCVFGIFAVFIREHKDITYQQISFLLASTVLIPESMLTLIKTEALDEKHGIVFMILGLCGAWIADSGAYFAGTFFGRHKLCPEISPKKTVEGFIGGIISTAVVFVLYIVVYSRFIGKEDMNINLFMLAVSGGVCAVIGTLGDLSASMIKRQCGIKDYGNIMPGHGGMMDRFDSVLFVMPTFYTFLTVADIYK